MTIKVKNQILKYLYNQKLYGFTYQESFDFGGSGPQDPFQQGFWQQGGFSEVDLNDIFGDIFGFGGPKRGRRGGRASSPFDFGGGGFGGGRNGADIQWKLPIEFLEAANGCEKNILLNDGQKIKVKIPAGVATGSKIRLAGKGHPGVGGGQAGDLIIEPEVREHNLFRREGDDVHVTIHVSVIEAIKGATIVVPTVTGDVQLKIPAGTQGGAKMRLKERGITNLKNKQRGHQFVHINILVPKDLSESDIAKLEDVLSKHPLSSRV